MEKQPLRINLQPKIKPIIKAVLSLRGFLMLLIALGALHTGITFLKESLLVALICFAGFVLFVILAKKFLEQVFYHEYLELKPEGISLHYKTFLQQKETFFEKENIKQFGFAGQVPYTHNAMHNPVFDITGLEASEKELQYVIDKGTLEIETEDGKHRFGKNMASWDAEEIIAQVEQYYGRAFKPIENTNQHD